MDKIEALLKEEINENLIRMIISNPREKENILKIKIRPVSLKNELLFQSEAYTKTQVFHDNDKKEVLIGKIIKWLGEFRQVQMETAEKTILFLVSKKGKINIQEKKNKQVVKPVITAHNREKNYILKEGIFVPFLEELGVMTKDGRVVKGKFDKFRQINRFLEFIEDVLPKLPKDREISILDFGCGKSYLTFAMYYYLRELKGYDVRILGLDLKKDVIAHCSNLAKKYGYDKLQFVEGNISDYDGTSEVDMVVTLHACDTATDMALAKAVSWNAKVILSVPCCQHELNGQIENQILQPILKYGLIKERMASLITDALRAEYLENQGYDVQILEFIDMEHTPKNILIRGMKSQGKKDNKKEIDECQKFLHLDPTLGRLLQQQEEV